MDGIGNITKENVFRSIGYVGIRVNIQHPFCVMHRWEFILTFNVCVFSFHFSVLMWELCTLARQPYQEVVNDDMEHFLSEGYRLAQPVNCPDELFAILAFCWTLSPLERPSFGQLQVCLQDFHGQLTRYI